MHRRAFLLASAFSLGKLALPNLRSQPATQRRLTTPDAALKLALADLRQLPEPIQLFTRYLWVQDADAETIQALSLTVNLVSRGPVIVRPLPVAGAFLLRIDLPSYYPDEADLSDAVKIWEEFQFDPKFNLLLTADTLKFAAQLGIDLAPHRKAQWIKVTVAPYRASDGQVYTWRWERRDTVELACVAGRHVDPAALAELIDRTRSLAPVVSADYFLVRALRQFQGAGIYKQIFGGLYYQLCGVKKSQQKGVTDEDLFFEQQLGIGNTKAGVTARQIYDRLRSDQRAAVFRSNVTGKPRQIEELPVPVGRDIQGRVFFTHDPKDEDVDLGQHAMLNLLALRDAAREVLYPRPNGLLGAALCNGQGALQDLVPPDVAADRTVPAPYTAQLEPIISCLRCHGPNDGYQPVRNDVAALTKRLDIFNDLSAKNQTQANVVSRLAGLYSGDLERVVMPRARDDQAALVLRASGTWRGQDQARAAAIGFAKISDLFGRYWYEQVDEKRALAELGVEGGSLEKLLLPAAPIDAGAGRPIIPEDPRIGALEAGLSISRVDWSLVYSFAATRIRK